mgnify:FL=1
MQENYMEELRNKKDLYENPPYRKVIVKAEIVMWLESEKMNIDYAKECAIFLLNTGLSRKSEFTHKDGREILDSVRYTTVESFKFD